MICVLSLTLGGTSPALADADEGAAIVADVFIARPACLVATVLGTAVFVISLPIALPARSVRRAAHVLVRTPARATFTRSLGDFDSLRDY